MTRETASNSTSGPEMGSSVDEHTGALVGETIHLESCPELEWITVRTFRSTYDIVVLSGDTGAVMVRGGKFFPEFHRATITGSMVNGITVKPRCISVGLSLELLVDEQSVITSRVQAIVRHHLSVVEGRA